MNNDLISRSALLDQMHNHYEVRNPKQNATMDECCMMVIHAPAVDAVEVVRCKDCKHKRERNEHERNYLVEGVLICTNPDATDDCWNPVWPEHFCSYGERRAADATD